MLLVIHVEKIIGYAIGKAGKKFSHEFGNLTKNMVATLSAMDCLPCFVILCDTKWCEA